MPLPSLSLATAEQFAQHKPGPVPHGIDRKLMQASAVIRSECGWHVMPGVEETLTVDGSGTTALLLPTMHLTGVLALTERGYGSYYSGPGGEYLWTTADLAALEWSADGYLRRWWPWTNRLRGVTVTIEHGHEYLEDVVGLAIDLAARAAASPAGEIRFQRGQVAGAPTMVAPNAAGGVVLMQHEKDLLAPYRISGRA